MYVSDFELPLKKPEYSIRGDKPTFANSCGNLARLFYDLSNCAFSGYAQTLGH